MQKFLSSIFGQVVIALILGLCIGHFYPDIGTSLKPLGDGFIKLIKMIIAPLIFCVVVTGIASAGNLKSVGRVGAKALIYFEVVTTIALAIGIAAAYIFQPGVGMNINTNTLDSAALGEVVERANSVSNTGFVDFILRIIPSTVVDAFAKGDTLQVLLFAILFGSALSLMGSSSQNIANFIESLQNVLFKIMGFIVRLAPLGVLGAVAFTAGKYGPESMLKLAQLVAVFYACVLLFVFGVLALIMSFTGLNLFKLLAYLKEELLVVFGTTSSDSVLPQIMAKLRALGIKESVVGLVIPTGYSFNLDAFSIYLTLAAVFIAQATNTPLDFYHLLMILGVAMVTSKGAHGVPGSALVILAATLSVVPSIPIIGVVLVLSIDWFIGIGRAVGNLIGNCVATVVVARWENAIDVEHARKVLNGEIEVNLN